jgi:hypothetical protein
MNIAFIGFLAFLFVGFSILNRVLDGAFVTGSDIAIVNNLTIFRNLQLFGLFNVPVPNLEFFTTGIPQLVKWNYTFFGGNAGIIQYFLYSATAAMAFGAFVITVGLLYQYFNRTR